MDRRLGLGPVFAAEWLSTSRRWQVYAGRVVFVGVLLLGLGSVWVSRFAQSPAPIQALAEIGESFYKAIVFTQLTLVILIAPAATAGVICQDRASGTLAQMLVTDLSDTEIILGKLTARLVPVAGLVCCALPVLALVTLLGGVDPEALTGVFLTTLGLAIFGCTLALTFSVWGTKPYEVLLATYGVFAVWLLSVPIVSLLWSLWRYPPLPEWIYATNPFDLSTGPYFRPGAFGLIHSVAMAATLVLISCALATLAIARIGNVAAGHSDFVPEDRRNWVPSEKWFGADARRLSRHAMLDDNPVLWYEVHRQQPSTWTRRLIRIYFMFAIGFTLLAIDDAIRGFPQIRGWFGAYVVAMQLGMSLTMLIVAATTALVEERARGSLDILLTTPISSRTIVLTKWWSVYRKLPLLLVLPTLIVAVLAWNKGHWIIAGMVVLYIAAAAAFWTSVGLAISTWAPKLGRAISLAAAIYAVAGLGWPIMVGVLFSANNSGALGLALIGPFHATFDLTYGIEQPGFLAHLGPLWYLGSIVAQAVGALVLLIVTLATFDRCIGRMRASRLPSAPPFDAPVLRLPLRIRG